MASERSQPAREIEQVLGVHPNTLAKWRSMGCPATKVGRGWFYNEAEVAAWMAETGVTGKPGHSMESEDLDQARLRKESAMARNWELRNAQLEGRLLDADEVERGRIERVTLVRNRLMGMGAALAPSAAGMDAAKIQDIIDEHARSICDAFARDN